MITCTKCKQEKGRDEFYNLKSKSNGKASWCKECNNTAANKPGIPKRSRLVSAARSRAKAKGIEFTITNKDVVIPTYCPVLGIEMIPAIGITANRDYSPSLDRIDPSRGYTPDNIQVISYLANRIKSNAQGHMVLRVGKWMVANGM